MPVWSAGETISGVLVGAVLGVLGVAGALDFKGWTAALARRDHERRLRQRWKTGMFPSRGTFRFAAAALCSMGVSLFLGGVAQATTGSLRDVFQVFVLMGAAGFVVRVISSVVASLRAERQAAG